MKRTKYISKNIERMVENREKQKPIAVVPPGVEPVILFENKDMLAVNKPAGMLVHGIYVGGKQRHDEPTLVDWVIARYPEIKGVGDPEARSGIYANTRPGIVHRLDRETSGVVLVARNQPTLLYLKGLFQAHQVKKTYLALVWGHVKEKSGVINKPISIKDGSTKRTVFKGKMTRPAVTRYQVIKFFKSQEGDDLTLLEVHPETGRTHQIRVHLSSIGHSVVGDKMYGKKKNVKGALQMSCHFLHAEKIELPLSDGKRIIISAPLTKELSDLLAALTPVTAGSE